MDDSLEANKQLVTRFVEECVNTHRADLLDDFVAQDVVMHPGTPGDAASTEGIDELRQAYRRFRVLVPDLHVEHELLLADGPYVVAHWTTTGTHTVELSGAEPTGRQLRWGGTDIYRIADGRIAEWWRNDDFAGLLRRLARRVA